MMAVILAVMVMPSTRFCMRGGNTQKYVKTEMKEAVNGWPLKFILPTVVG